jgi:hypothetical protein
LFAELLRENESGFRWTANYKARGIIMAAAKKQAAAPKPATKAAPKAAAAPVKAAPKKAAKGK